jgi:putative integral membrane protein (TIGR02587 family)
MVSLGIGVSIATVMLLVLGQLSAVSSLREWAGKIALESVPVAIGASVARGLLGERDEGDEPGSIEPGALGQVIVAAGGALFFALNVAPTEEPVLIGIGNEWWLNLVLLALTVPVTFGIVFYADFRGSHRRRREGGDVSPALTPAGETLVSLAAALVVSALLLWLFGRPGSDVGPGAAVAQVVTLGFVAAVGASAARLLL